MSHVIEKIMRGEVVIQPKGSNWKISSIGTNFLDWIRKNYPDEEDKTWQIWYYSGSMCIIEVVDERMMTMINLRWQ
jgi:hypothetical protein